MKTHYEIKRSAKISRISGLIGCFLIILLMQSCMSTVYVPERRTTVRTEVVPPPWAPPYENVQEVHYYYLPDVEMYYDVWSHEYIYLQNGNWVYTTAYPSYYSSYDINSAYVIVLDAKVSEPWRHHDLYVSHYPRYYYRSVYDEDGRHRDNNRRYDNRGYNANEYRGNVRGFNENVKTPIYRNGPPSDNSNRRYTMPNNNNNNTNYTGNERSRPARRSDATGENGNRTTVNPGSNNPSYNQNSQGNTRQENENVAAPGRRTENNQPANNVERRTENQQNNEVRGGRTDNNNQNNQNNQNRNTEQTQRSQPAVYPGKDVGQPVRVRRNMQPAKDEKKQGNVQQKNTQTDESKSKKDDSKKEDDSRRRRN